jgi:hypothetical protein
VRAVRRGGLHGRTQFDAAATPARRSSGINLFAKRNGQTLVPMVPALLVIAAWCSVSVFEPLAARLKNRNRRVLAGLAVLATLVIVGYPLAGGAGKPGNG